MIILAHIYLTFWLSVKLSRLGTSTRTLYAFKPFHSLSEVQLRDGFVASHPVITLIGRL
ncbi:hypothetical protein LINPERHAP1_LOCUS30893 [Linum perenne]